MKDIFATIDEAGGMILPRSVRQRLAIKPGAILKIAVAGFTVTLTPTRFVKKGKALVFTTSNDKTLRTASVRSVIESTRLRRSR
jgi:bifunctional DNA-binding transcriptional regulator/antitoxin component of YhaV-PrlF toxin-antitoxin module